MVRLLNTRPYGVCTSICDCPGDIPLEVIDEDEGTETTPETTRTPSRAGVTVSESVGSLDIDTLWLRRAEWLAATVAMVLILAGNISDCIPLPPAALAGDVDALLTAWTSSIVFCPEELLPTGRPDSTRPLLLTDIIPRLLLDSCMLTDGDAEDTAAVAETIHTNIKSVTNIKILLKSHTVSYTG